MGYRIRPTPVVKGRDARCILNEMRNGTPDTPKRVETIRRADEVYQKMEGWVDEQDTDQSTA